MNLLLLPVLLLAFSPAGGEGEAAARGRHFYQTGKTEEQRGVKALIGNPATSVPAAVLPCVNCHGRRGYGRPEGGMIPADISWSSLTRPYEVVTESGRRRPAYDQKALIRAITAGVDSGGTRLDPNMPRYELQPGEAADLVSWLRHMQDAADPGIDEATVQIGLLLAPGETRAAETWRAFVADLAARGGIYGRQPALRPLELTGEPDRDGAALRDLVDRDEPFMLVMPGQAAVPPHLAEFAHQRQIPLLGHKSLAPPPLHHEVFYLYPGEGSHGQVLAAHVDKHHGQGITAILTRPGLEKAAAAIVDWSVRRGWTAPPHVFVLDPHGDPAISLKRLAALRPKYIINLGIFDEEVARLATLLEQGEQQCTVLSPGTLTTAAWLKPRRAWARLLVTTGIQPEDMRAGAATYNRLVRSQDLPARPTGTGIAALAGAVLVREALLASGREPNRETLIKQLEGRYRFQTGFAPAISYDPNRRVGVEAIYLHDYDFRQGRTRFLEAADAAASGDIQVTRNL